MKRAIYFSLPLLVFLSTFAGAASITLQQGLNSYAGTYDTWLSMDEDSMNYGNDTALHVRRDLAGTYDDRATLLRFDLAGRLPADSVIDSASLSLLYYDDWSIIGSDSLTVSAYKLVKSWTEGTSGNRMGASWYYRFASPDNTQWYNGGARGVNQDRASAADASVTLYDIGSGYMWITFSGAAVRNTVQGWYDNPASNFGWVLDVLASNDNTNGAIFHSSEYGTGPDYQWRPKLDITYTVIPEPATIAIWAVAAGSGFLRRKKV